MSLERSAQRPRIRSFRVLLTPLTYIHVGHIVVNRCSRCGEALRVLAVITEPRVIAAILAHLETRAARAPPPVRH